MSNDDLFVAVSLGAGTQSSAVVTMADRGLITPRPNVAIFADTQAEPDAVYEWLDFLESQVSIPIVRITAGSLADDELTLRVSGKTGKTYRRTLIPAFAKHPDGSKGIMGRKCTADYKVRPITRKLRELANIKRGEKEVKIEQWLGISTDEMQRMKDSREPWIRHRWPLIEMRMHRHDCIEYVEKELGRTPPRSACTFCPFHSNEEWNRLTPSEMAAAEAFEVQMQEVHKSCEVSNTVPYLHASLLPLREALAVGEEQERFSFMDECEGLCGT